MLEPLKGIVQRRLLAIALDRLHDEPVLLLQGPRSVGKSHLLLEIAANTGAEMVDLDDLATRAAVTADPALFVSGSKMVCLDEYQHVPEVLDAIKAELNRDLRPGRYVLTGSTRFDALASTQALTGRLHRLEVMPLSQGELAGTTETLLETSFDDLAATLPVAKSTTSREEYVDRVVRGGFPLALARRSDTARHRWIDDYVRLVVERDVIDLSRIRHAATLPLLLERLAAQTAQLLNVSNAGAQVGLEMRTADSYTRLLEAVFLIHRLPAWGTRLMDRATKSPKVHLVDSAVAARLLGLTSQRLLGRDPTALSEFGHLLETFIVGELRKQASWMDGIAAIGHWRTSNGDEVDLVVERDDGSVVAFEVKAGGRVTGQDLKSLQRLRGLLGNRFKAGVALYLGERAYTYDDRIHVLPADRLWDS